MGNTIEVVDYIRGGRFRLREYIDCGKVVMPELPAVEIEECTTAGECEEEVHDTFNGS
jgi:hypothetical protein